MSNAELGAELLEIARVYLAGQAAAADLHNFVYGDVDGLEALDATEDPGSGLSGIIMVTLAEMDLGHASDGDLRERIAEYMAEHRLYAS